MVTSIFLAQVSLLVLALNDIVYLHTIVAFGRKEQTSKVIKADG